MQPTPLRSALITPPTLARVQEKRVWDEDEFEEEEEEAEEEEEFDDHEAVFFSVTIAKGTTADKLTCAPTTSLQGTRQHRLRAGDHGGKFVFVRPF
jgi:hypothetical protein